MKLYRQAHVVYKTQYHLLWVTRYRRNILVPGIAEYLKKVLRAVRAVHPDWFFEESGVERDYVHLPRVIPPKYAVSKAVETLKSVTSLQLKEKLHSVRAGFFMKRAELFSRPSGRSCENWKPV